MSESFSWKKIFIYYGIALAITWFISFMIVVGVFPEWFHYFNALGPLLATFFVVWKTNSFGKLLSLFHIRKLKWFLVGGTSPIWVTALLYFIAWIFKANLPSLNLLFEVNFLGNIGFLAIFLWIISFGIGEEIGWRGFLLPELLKKHGIIKSTLILWGFWTLWHLPFFFYIPNYLNMNLGAIFGFVFSLLSGSILLSWVFINSNKSLPTVILWHACFDFVTASAFGSGNIAMILSMVVIFSSLAIFIKWLIDAKKARIQ